MQNNLAETEKSSAVSAVSAFSISDAAVTAFSPTSEVDVPSGKVIRIKGSFEARNRLHHSMNNEFYYIFSRRHQTDFDIQKSKLS